MTSEDPNIATLRDDARYIADAYPGTSSLMLQAIDALASTLAERDRRIAELEQGHSAFLADVRDELRLKPGDGILTAVQALKNRAAAHPAPAPGELALRPAVAWFAQAMERKLRANDHKGGWLDGKCDLLFLFGKLEEERRELYRAVGGKGGPLIALNEAADVANIAMMIADLCQTEARPVGWEQPASGPLLPALNGGDDNG